MARDSVTALLVAGLLVLGIAFSLTPVAAQSNFERTFTWYPNSPLTCPGDPSGCEKGLTSQEFAVLNGFTHFDIALLEAGCDVANNGPENAAFDIGIIFGPYSVGQSPFPRGSVGTYRGAAFGWIGAIHARPAWSIDFHSRNVNATGSPIYNEIFLLPSGNVFDSPDGVIHLMISVWSAATTNFELVVSNCYVHLVYDASQLLRVTMTQTFISSTTVVVERVDTTTVLVPAFVGVAVGAVTTYFTATKKTGKQRPRKGRAGRLEEEEKTQIF